METSVSVDISNALRTFANLKHVPLHKAILNFSRDFARGAYKATPVAKKSKSSYYRFTHKGWPSYIHEDLANRIIDNGSKRGIKLRRLLEIIYGVKFHKVRIAKGWSKSSWIGVFRQLGMPSNKPNALSSKVTEIGTAAVRNGGMAVRILDDIEFTATHPEDAMFNAGFKSAAAILNKNFQKLIEQQATK